MSMMMKTMRIRQQQQRKKRLNPGSSQLILAWLCWVAVSSDLQHFSDKDDDGLSSSFVCDAFSTMPRSIITTRTKGSTWRTILPATTFQSSSSSSDNSAMASFNGLLARMEQDGVALLSCDAGQVHTLQAALWSSLAELSQQDQAKKICLIFPPNGIPTPALQAFCRDFFLAQSKEHMQQHLPEINRLSVSLVQQDTAISNNNIPRALLLEAQARSEESTEIKEQGQQWATWASQLNEHNCRAAMASFVNRVVVQKHVCPYMKTAESASTGNVVYHYSDTSDACAGIAEFWNCLVELLSTKPEELSSTVLSLPGIAPLHPEQLQANKNAVSLTHDRFSALVELASQSLCLYKADEVFSLVHFHPLYTRSWIEPRDHPAYGHLPPQDWLRSMMIQNHPDTATAQQALTDDQLEWSNFQRRAPHTAINILRVAQLEDSTNTNLNIVDLQLPDGRFEKASGLTTYSRNAVTLAETGQAALEAAVASDLKLQDVELWG